MNRADIRSFVGRDWSAVERMKARFWLDERRRLTPTDVLAIGDDLRRHVRSLRPDWPDAVEQAADRAVHLRVSEALRAVHPTRGAFS
jgi:hypothetical protein